jgi:single-strand DNA-binding protein
MSVNKVILVGRLGADPEVRYSGGGTAVTNFRLATDRKYTNKQGEKVDETEWHRCVAFGRTGEICGEYLHKGSQVYVEGRIRTRDWEDKDGNKRWTTEILVEQMKMLGSKGERPERAASPSPGDDPFDRVPDMPPEDDIPF